MNRPRTTNHEKVLAALAGNGPVTAYALLDRLRPQGFKAPLTVYRALERLVAEGRVHRLESLNAYVACRYGACRNAPVFALCRKCGASAEIAGDEALTSLRERAAGTGFAVEGATVELKGVCGDCSGG